MPRVQSESVYNNFIQGIITEAGPLTYPENASLDELNYVLQRDGSRHKRLGIDYEDNYVLKNSGLSAATVSRTGVSFHRWDYPKGSLEISLGIVRIYNKLWFVNLLNVSPSTEFMNSGNALSINGLANGRIDTASINNELIIVGEDLSYPIKLEYDVVTDTVTYSTLYLKIRDFFGVDDGLDVSDRPTILSDEHLYNLKNQGWNDNIQVKNYGDAEGDAVGAAIEYTYSKKGWYPSNADIWYYGRHENPNKGTYGYYVANELAKNSLNNSQAPQGSYIIDFKNRGASRSEASGVDLTIADTETGNLTCITSFAGRVFYSGILSSVTDGDANSPNYSSYIFFTPTLFNNKRLDECYQEADPTGEKVSDLIASDGGVIVIPEMLRVVKLIALEDVLLIFAENGIWLVSGGDSGFKATEYQVKKISDTGTGFPDSIVVAEGGVFFWSNTGIYSVTFGEKGLSPQNLSLTTIQTLYNSYSQAAKKHAIGIYEERNSRVRWLINLRDDYDGINYKNKYNYELIYDIPLGAFYPLKVSVSNSALPYIAAPVSRPYYTIDSVIDNVNQNGVQVRVNTENVTSTSLVPNASSFDTSYLVLQNVSGTFSFTFGKYKNTDFVDWYGYDSVGQSYDAYLIAGYEIFKDAMRTKAVPYLYVYSLQTETAFATAGGSLALTNPSSCLVQAQWNWSNSTASGKWGTQFQAYRFKRDFTPSGNGASFSNGETMVVTKNKLRGNGKSLSLYFYSPAGFDSKLVGWAVAMDAGRMAY